MHLRKALEKVSPITGENLIIQRLQNALTNQVYQLTSKSSKKVWALRLNKHTNIELGIDRKREEEILNSIEGNAWAVKPDFFQKDICLTQWIHGQHFSLSSSEQLTELTDLITAIHCQPLESLVNTKPMRIDIQLIRLMDQLTLKPTADFTQLLLKKVQQYQPPKDLSLCHFDIHPGNLLISDSGLKLLDWEYASLGDRLIDIACVLEGFQLNNSKQKQFLNAFNLSTEQMQLPICLTQALSLLWYMNRFPDRNYNRELTQWVEEWRE